MKGIVYVSEMAIDFDSDSILRLADLASRANEKKGITGYLYHDKANFLQYIEGTTQEVKKLFAKIEVDPRHKIIAHLEDTILQRKFPTWHMEYLTLDRLMEINMESVIISHMSYMKRIAAIDNQSTITNDQVIWRMIDKLSQFKPLTR